MAWNLRINLTDGSSFVHDDQFDTEAEAREEFDAYLDSWGAGRETLELAGEDYIDADIEDCDIWED